MILGQVSVFPSARTVQVESQHLCALFMRALLVPAVLALRASLGTEPLVDNAVVPQHGGFVGKLLLNLESSNI